MNLDETHLDAIQEVVNIGIGKAASLINEMVENHVELHVPQVTFLNMEELNEKLEPFSGSKLVSVQLGFNGILSGNAALIFPPDSASELVNVLVGESSDDDDFDELMAGTLSEFGNIILNGVMGNASNIFGLNLEFEVPQFLEDRLEDLMPNLVGNIQNIAILLVESQFEVKEQKISGKVLIFFEVSAIEAFAKLIDDFLN